MINIINKLEKDNPDLKVRIINYGLYVFSYFASVVTMQQIFEAIIPGVNTGHWSYSFPLIVVLPLTVMYFFSYKSIRKNV